MTCHYLDPDCASYWLKHISLSTGPIRSTTQTWAVIRYQYGISAPVPQTSFRQKASCGVAKFRLFSKATDTSNIKFSCVFLAKEQPKQTSFLWLWLLIGRFMINVLIWIYGPSYNAFYSQCFAEKQCPLYEPPDNGALTCNYIGSDPSCSVQCQNGYDFVYTPPFVYYCSGGEWKYFSIAYYDPILPWPDCASKYIAIKELVVLMDFSYG